MYRIDVTYLLISSINTARVYFVYLHVVCVENSFTKIHSYFFITFNERRSSFQKCEFGASDVVEHESGRLDQWILTFFVSKRRKKATTVRAPCVKTTFSIFSHYCVYFKIIKCIEQ